MNEGPLPHCDVTSLAYWSERVRRAKTLEDMIWEDNCRDRFWAEVEAHLSAWSHRTVLDVACGHGQFAECFQPSHYLGVDFCPEMVALSKQRHPGYEFVVDNARRLHCSAGCEVVFQVNSLRSMGMAEDEFFELGWRLASFAVASFEKGRMRVEYRW